MNSHVDHFVRIALLIVVLGANTRARGEECSPLEGFSHPHRLAHVAAATSGIIEQWLVEEGEFVSAGQPLAKLDDALHRKLVAIAKANAESRGELELATAEHELRTQRLAAIEELARQGHATPDELHRAQTEARVAAARLTTAHENQLRHALELDKLQAQSETYTVTAPFDGFVKKVHKFKGEFVGPVEPEVCELADLTHISARFLAPHDKLGKLKTGDTVRVRFPSADKTLEGIVTLAPYPDAETGMRSLRVKIDNRDGILAAGYPCTLELAR